MKYAAILPVGNDHTPAQHHVLSDVTGREVRKPATARMKLHDRPSLVDHFDGLELEKRAWSELYDKPRKDRGRRLPIVGVVPANRRRRDGQSQ